MKKIAEERKKKKRNTLEGAIIETWNLENLNIDGLNPTNFLKSI